MTNKLKRVRVKHVILGIKGLNMSYYWWSDEPLKGCIYLVAWRWVLFVSLWNDVGIYPNIR